MESGPIANRGLEAGIMSDENHDHSVTEHLGGLIEGDQDAINRIWERYFGRVLQLARARLRDCPRRYLDEDDVTQHAFANFFQQVKQGRFPKLDNRNDLWQVLAMIVNRKAIDQFRAVTSQKNGYGKVRGGSINQNSELQPVVEAVKDLEPTGEIAAEFSEEFERRLDKLDKNQRNVVMLKLTGHKNREIAQKLDTPLRTVERWLAQIRDRWEKEEDHVDRA